MWVPTSKVPNFGSRGEFFDDLHLGPTRMSDVAAPAGTSPLAGTAPRGPPLVEKFLGTPTWALYLSGPTLGSIISGDPRMSRGDPQMVFHPLVRGLPFDERSMEVAIAVSVSDFADTTTIRKHRLR